MYCTNCHCFYSVYYLLFFFSCVRAPVFATSKSLVPTKVVGIYLKKIALSSVVTVVLHNQLYVCLFAYDLFRIFLFDQIAKERMIIGLQ